MPAMAMVIVAGLATYSVALARTRHWRAHGGRVLCASVSHDSGACWLGGRSRDVRRLLSQPTCSVLYAIRPDIGTPGFGWPVRTAEGSIQGSIPSKSQLISEHQPQENKPFRAHNTRPNRFEPSIAHWCKAPFMGLLA